MKRLLLDIGNTRLKWALADGERRGPAQAIAHGGDPAAIAAALPATTVRAIHISSVLGEAADRQLSQRLDARYGRPPRYARVVAERNGLRVAYTQPQRLGVDRWLGMQRLWRESGSGFVLASAGTALTVDLVDDGGRHLGGYIAPGLVAMQQGVLGATRFEHRAVGLPPRPEPGDSTEACVRNAALTAALGLLERSSRGHPGPRLISGGDAALLLEHLDGDWQRRDDLVLDALLDAEVF